MGWDFMYPRGYQPRRGRGQRKRNRCLACRADIGTPKINGQKVTLNYCQKHYCARMLAGGTICTQQNNGKSAYCDNHGRCQATGDEGRCWRMVKEENPEKYKWCKDHGCAYPTCTSRRTDASSLHCTLHRCANSACDKPRQMDTASFFCERHTCEAGTCTAEVEGRGEKGDPSRYCDHHRRCAAAGCARRCHTRDTLVTTRWCGAHYCHTEACEEPRSAHSGKYCAKHLCLEPGCTKGKKDMGGGRFCMEHQCKADGCTERRDQRARGAEHCPLHLCVIEGCPKPAAGGSRCENHRYCSVNGCREWIYIEKGPDCDIKYPECEKHHRPRCHALIFGTSNQCDKRVTGTTLFCEDHSCAVRACPDQRRADSLQYCPAHKCGAAGCQAQVKGVLVGGLDVLLSAPLRASLLLTTMSSSSSSSAAGLGLGLGSGSGSYGGGVADALGMSRFCANHSCQGDGGRCGAEVVVTSDQGAAGGGRRRRWDGETVRRFCFRHECAHRGCRAEATHQSRRNSRGGMCDRHYRKQKDGGGGGGGGFGPPMGMPMPMGMGFPPFFGGPVYDSSESSSDSDDGMRPRGLPFGAPFF